MQLSYGDNRALSDSKKMLPGIDTLLTTEKNELKKVAVEHRVSVNTVFDCGSRDAIDGIELGKIFDAREVHFFECNPDSAIICRKNIANEKSASFKMILNEVALGDRMGETSFFAIDPEKTVTPHPGGNVGASSLFKASSAYKKERYVQREIKVPMITLGNYLESHQVPNLIWMDLQGAEVMALNGFGSKLSQVDLIHIEVSFRPMYVGQALFGDVHAFLSRDFELVHIELGRWPKLLELYKLLRFGPWVSNAIYVNKGKLPP